LGIVELLVAFALLVALIIVVRAAFATIVFTWNNAFTVFCILVIIMLLVE
jgi:hypothetical protein